MRSETKLRIMTHHNIRVKELNDTFDIKFFRGPCFTWRGTAEELINHLQGNSNTVKDKENNNNYEPIPVAEAQRAFNCGFRVQVRSWGGIWWDAAMVDRWSGIDQHRIHPSDAALWKYHKSFPDHLRFPEDRAVLLPPEFKIPDHVKRFHGWMFDFDDPAVGWTPSPGLSGDCRNALRYAVLRGSVLVSGNPMPEPPKAVADIKDLAYDLRADVLDVTKRVGELRTHPDVCDRDVNSTQRDEMHANILLAYRHLEDARMRLGKVVQAYDGGESCYPK